MQPPSDDRAHGLIQRRTRQFTADECGSACGNGVFSGAAIALVANGDNLCARRGTARIDYHAADLGDRKPSDIDEHRCGLQGGDPRPRRRAEQHVAGERGSSLIGPRKQIGAAVGLQDDDAMIHGDLAAHQGTARCEGGSILRLHIPRGNPRSAAQASNQCQRRNHPFVTTRPDLGRCRRDGAGKRLAAATHPPGTLMKRTLRALPLAIACALAAPPSLAATLTVTSNADAGIGSLREAIIIANTVSAGADRIEFAIPDGDDTRIRLLSRLPAIVGPLVIDGFSQPGSQRNTLLSGDTSVHRIVLDGSAIAAGANGIDINDARVEIAGLTIDGFRRDGSGALGNGIAIGASLGDPTEDQIAIVGCHIGLAADGTEGLGNEGAGIRIFSATEDGSRPGGAVVLVGPDSIADPGNRNVIADNSAGGIIAATPLHRIEGNFIGMTADGRTPLPNGGAGISLASAPAQVGPGNIIAGNLGDGVLLAGPDASNPLAIGAGYVVEGNRIGVDVANGAAGNGGNGVLITDGVVDALVGGIALADQNILHNNLQAGVRILGDASQRNDVAGNSFAGNGGLGIDLGPAGPDANDAGDADTGPNAGQNAPVLTSIEELGGNQRRISGTLATTPNTTALITLYRNVNNDASGRGEGLEVIHREAVITDGTGTASFAFVVDTTLVLAGPLSATATVANAGTSEFSLALDPAGPVGGRLDGLVFEDTDGDGIRDAGETALAGIGVFDDADGDGTRDPGETRVVTLLDGRFTFELASDATVRVVVEVPPSLRLSSPLPSPIAVSGGATVSAPDVGLAALPPPVGGRVEGLVFSDTDGDGIRDGGENPLAGIGVFDDTDGDGIKDPAEARVLTQADGRYVFDLAADATVRVVVEVPPTLRLSSPLPGPILVSGGGTLIAPDLGLATLPPPPLVGGRVEGLVFEDLDDDGLRDAGEGPLGGIAVFDDRDADGNRDAGEARFVTAADGRYRFDLDADGSVRIVVEVPANRRLTSATPAPITVSGGATLTAPELGLALLKTGGSASGRLFLDDDRNGTRAPDEAGAAGLRVFDDDDRDGVLDAGETAVVTASTGDYTFTFTDDGDLSPAVELGNGFSLTTALPATVRIEAGATLTLADIGVVATARGGELSGSVFEDTDADGIRDPGEAGLAGVTVFSDDNADGQPSVGEPSAVSDAVGAYRLLIADDQEVRVRALAPAGRRQTTGAAAPQRVEGGDSVVAADVGFSGILTPPPQVVPAASAGMLGLLATLLSLGSLFVLRRR